MIEDIVQKLNAKQCGDHTWKAHCPAHGDTNASLSITEKGGKILVHCLAGCDWKSVLYAAGIEPKELFTQVEPKPMPFKYGLTLAEYAQSKGFHLELLKSWLIHDGTYQTQKGQKYPGVAMPYLDRNGNQTAIRWRMRISKEKGSEPSRFLWNKGGKLSLYGLWLLQRTEKYVVLVEGESDCHSLWSIGINALGIPGADNYRSDRDDREIEFFETIYIHIEKDTGGKTVFTKFAGKKGSNGSPLLSKIKFFSLAGYKDPSEAWQSLHDQPEEFRRLMGSAMRDAKDASTFIQPECWKETKETETKDGRAVSSPENGSRGGRPQTDYIGMVNAYCGQKMDAEKRLTLRYWRNSWYQFNGKCYKPRLDSDIEGNAVSWLQNLDVAERFHVQPSTNALRNLLLGLRSSKYCGLPAEMESPSFIHTGESAAGWIAMDNVLLNLEQAAAAHYEAVNSGTVVDPSGFTMPLTPDLLSTFSMSYKYDPSAQCPNFMQWLRSSQPEPEMQRAIAHLMGLSIVPDTSYNVCFFIYGEAGTGKSTFLDLLEGLVGEENICRVPLLNMGDRFGIWPLAESLLNIVGELPTDDPLGRLRYIEGDFKDTVSGGNITIERKGKDVCTGRCTARHVFSTNHLPIFFDKSEGIWDRLIIIPFEQRFRGGGNEIRDISKIILRDELPGMLNFALWGLADLRRFTRFPEPEPCANAKKIHRERCDFDASYLEDFYEEFTNGEVELSAAYQHYRSQLTINGLAPRSSPTFQSAVTRYFGMRAVPRSSSDRTRVFRGLRAKFVIASSQNVI